MILPDGGAQLFRDMGLSAKAGELVRASGCRRCCSSVHGTFFIALWVMLARVLSESGKLSHFAAGKVLQACMILVPQIPVQERPESRKKNSTIEM